jgi:hypothetical protein
MVVRLPPTHGQRQTRTAVAPSTLADIRDFAPIVTTRRWPRRPDLNVLNPSIPLFFISRDDDGFWVACEADFRIGGIFLSQHSAMRFAQRCSAPAGCATMILEGPHNLEIENHGNRFADWLRPAVRFVRSFAARFRSISERLSRAYIEDRMLRAALEASLYRGHYKHSNKNDDDLPIVTEIHPRKRAGKTQRAVAEIKNAWPVIIAFATFVLVLAGIIALRVMIWLPDVQH